MVTTPKDATEILKQAATAAEQLIPIAEKRRDELQAQLAQAELMLTRLRNVISSSQLDPSVMGMTSTTTVTSSSGTMITSQAAPPSAYIKMHMVLGKASQPLSVKEILEAFRSEFNEEIPQSTVYFALNKGLRKNTFANEEGMWRLKKKP